MKLFSKTIFQKTFQKTAKNNSHKSLPNNYLAGSAIRSYMVMPGQPVWSQRDYYQFANEAYAKNVIAYRSMQMIASSAASVPFILYYMEKSGVKREIENHPLLRLLSRPNPMQSGNEFLQALFNFKMISGNAYVQSVSAKDSPPSELYLLRPDRVQIIAGRNAIPAAYRYNVDDKTIDFPVDRISGRSRILHLKNFHPTNDWYGLSPIEAAAYSIDQHNQSSQWNQSLMQNGARPSGALVVRGDQGAGVLSEDQYNRMKLQIDEQFSGPANAGRPLLLEGGLEWKEMSLSPKDMDFIQSKNSSARDIALAFGVPPQLLGIPGDNTYSNFQEARAALWEQTILPLAESTVDSLNHWLLPMFGESLKLCINVDNILPLATRNQIIWDRIERASFLTDNEKRAAVGYDPLEEVEKVEEDESLMELSPLTPSTIVKSMKYSSDQPRVSSGNSDGGQWTSDGGDSNSSSERGAGESSSSMRDISEAKPRSYSHTAKAPALTVHSNTHISISHVDGTVETRQGGSRAWRNNNPGNIVAGKFANTHGAIGNNNGFAVFPDEETGQRASAALLRTSTYSKLSIDQAIARRSPPNENDTPQLQQLVRKLGNFSGNEVIGQLDDQQMSKLTDIIKRTEGWKVGKINRSKTPL